LVALVARHPAAAPLGDEYPPIMSTPIVA